MASITGPLPTGEAQRRNKPTIPTTKLPAKGRPAPVPKPPVTYELGTAGLDWWRWAWRLPQACGWDSGALFVVARRAQLEDDLHCLEHVEFDFEEILSSERSHAARALRSQIGILKALAGGKLAVLREARELDDRLGLTPKGMAALRWKIVPDEETEGHKPAAKKRTTSSRSRRLKAVPPASS